MYGCIHELEEASKQWNNIGTYPIDLPGRKDPLELAPAYRSTMPADAHILLRHVLLDTIKLLRGLRLRNNYEGPSS
jgi:hypothetical protein